MTPEDVQMDLLLRRYADHGGRPLSRLETAKVGDQPWHLDADELNAFAEGALPPAVRSRYVSHLADCNQCRKLATELAMAAGLTMSVETEPAPKESAPASVWERLAGLFAVTKLRYAAFALVVVAATGITFLALRRERGIRLIAENHQTDDRRGDAVGGAQPAKPAANPSAPVQPGTVAPSLSASSPASAPRQPEVAANEKVLDGAEARKEAGETKDDAAKQTTLDKKAETEAAPPATQSYAPAPPPPAEQREAQLRPVQQEPRGGIQPEQNVFRNRRANDNFGNVGQTQSARSGNRDTDEENTRAGKAANNRLEADGLKDKNAKAEDALAARAQDRSTVELSKQGPDQTVKSPAKAKTAAGRPAEVASSDAPIEMRKVAGHSFHRQNSEWVDTRFKTSMSIVNVSRNSDDFRRLDSGLRTIAGQLSGQIVVVWKGKAYRIR